MNSILTSVKLLLGIIESDTSFDNQLIIHINTVFALLYRMGVGSDKFVITGPNETWNDFMWSEDDYNIEDVKTYVALKVGMIFDPPASSIKAEATKEIIKELEWSLNIEVDDWEGLE